MELQLVGKGKKIHEKLDSNCSGNPVRPRLCDLKGAASYLNCSVDRVRTLIYSHQVQVIQVGNGKIWLDYQELDRWVDEKLHLIGEPLA